MDALMDDAGERTVEILDGAGKMNALEINKAAKELEAFDKNSVLKICRLWFRDVLVYKSTGQERRLFFYRRKEDIMKTAREISWEGANRAVEAVKEASDRLDANVKAEAVYESLLLAVRESSGQL